MNTIPCPSKPANKLVSTIPVKIVNMDSASNQIQENLTTKNKNQFLPIMLLPNMYFHQIATALDLNMGHYTIRLDCDSPKSAPLYFRGGSILTSDY